MEARAAVHTEVEPARDKVNCLASVLLKRWGLLLITSAAYELGLASAVSGDKVNEDIANTISAGLYDPYSCYVEISVISGEMIQRVISTLKNWLTARFYKVLKGSTLIRFNHLI